MQLFGQVRDILIHGHPCHKIYRYIQKGTVKFATRVLSDRDPCTACHVERTTNVPGRTSICHIVTVLF